MRWLKALFCLALSAASFSSLPYIAQWQRAQYAKSEPFFKNPVPVQSNVVIRIRKDSYGKGYFGASRSNGRTHKGIDVIAPLGQAVFAAKSGRVVVAGVDKGYGNFVEIHHPDGLCTRYAHLSGFAVTEGQWVVQGQLVGKSGKTGNANHSEIIPHLHFEIRRGEEALNPTSGLLDPSIFVN